MHEAFTEERPSPELHVAIRKNLPDSLGLGGPNGRSRTSQLQARGATAGQVRQDQISEVILGLALTLRRCWRRLFDDNAGSCSMLAGLAVIF